MPKWPGRTPGHFYFHPRNGVQGGLPAGIGKTGGWRFPNIRTGRNSGRGKKQIDPRFLRSYDELMYINI